MTAAILWSDVADLYREYHQQVYAYVNHKVSKPGGSNELADDITAEVFLRAIEAMCEGHGPTSSVRGWLYRIAHNLCIDEYRYRSRRGAAIDFDALAELPGEGMTPHEQVVSNCGCERIWTLVHQLKDEQEQVVMLHVECESDTELATRAGVHIQAAKGRLHRGRARLAEMLSEGVT